MIRSPPPNWPLPILNFDWTGTKLNISQNIDEGIELLHEASENGANFVMFPELWFPGFPKGADGNWSRDFLPDYIENSMVVGDANWNRLIDGIRSAGVYTALAFAERTGKYLYMAQALISPLGDILIHRHKLRPSGSERAIFTDGTIGEIVAVTTSLGRVGLLECGEHWYPSMTFPLQAQAENFHIAPFPYMLEPANKEAAWWEGAFANIGTLGHYSNLAGATSFVTAVGVAFVVSPLAQLEAYISDTVDFTKTPILYHSIETSGFNTSKTYDADSQTSWGVLQQILNGFPSYIPRDEGEFVDWHSIDINLELSGEYNMSAPGSAGPGS
ncbi:hypothetical protein G7Z17_g7787 [Cylindrodendrum hubeiense]|uniref:CN hydrolase domain-containing protein n=1 Tax=Cylindrodendrum hubeiense TaxID=595255 RepID=A0A9P5LF00_9HYPO|nr:hypothetical protein G7Z17_g7787 [Cylindrodendrum hubeiense]